jgi:formylglycine-generating enzyme required for sulfatase activity
MAQVRILFLSANPADTGRLSLGNELHEIDARIRVSDGRDRITLLNAAETRIDEFARTLQIHKPHVVHFSGHGSTDGSILLADGEDRAAAADPNAVTDVFAALARDLGIRCVVLNACYSATLADTLRAHVDCVIGAPGAIPDRVAIAFAGGFYESIGFGRDLAAAYQLALAQVRLLDLETAVLPRMVCREGVQPESVRLLDDVRDDALSDVAPPPITQRATAAPTQRKLRAGTRPGSLLWDGDHGLGVEMVAVAPGSVLLGDESIAQATPRVQVSFAKGFYAARFPTTVGEFARFVRETSYVTDAERHLASATWRAPRFAVAQSDRHPVTCLTADDAAAYATWAGLSLPTENEWEYLARGPGARRFPWGDDAPTASHLWWSASGAQRATCPVGEHPAGRSWCGAEDVVGNVEVWTADPWAPQRAGPLARPDTSRRAVRGCGWSATLPRQAWAAWREGAVAVTPTNSRGLRLVLRANDNEGETQR